MNIDHYQQLWNTLNRIFPVSGELFLQLTKTFYPLKYRRKQVLIAEGVVPPCIGFVTAGIFKYYYLDKNGTEYIKHFTMEGDFVASYSSFLNQTPSLYFIEALEDAEILAISFIDYINALDSRADWQTIARKYTEEIYRIKEVRESSLLKETAEQRYYRFLHENPGLDQRIKQKYIASFLGISPVSLSRIRKRLSLT